MSLMGLDVGTTGCKAVVFDLDGNILASSYREYPLLHPKPGWIEINPNQVWESVVTVIREVSSRTIQDPIKSFAVSSLGEACVPVDKNGAFLDNSIIGFDTRGAEFLKFWENQLGKEKPMKISGMPLSNIYTINKIMWIKKYKPSIFKKAWKFLCFEELVYFKLGLEPTVDYSLAARTMCLDIKKGVWSKEILELAGVEESSLAKVVPSGTVVGEVKGRYAEELNLLEGTVAVTGGHDQPCGALGAGIIKKDIAMDATGTVECVCPAFAKPLLNKKMLDNGYACYPHVVPGMFVTIAFNFTGGSLLRWYRDTLADGERIEAKNTGRDVYDIIIEKASNTPSNIYVLPHFTTTGTPYFDHRAKGAIIGLTLATKKSEIVRGILDGITLEIKMNLSYLEKAGLRVNELRAIGGGAKSRKWMQIKADIFNKPVKSLSVSEAACLGCAMLAGVAIGEYKSLHEAVDRIVKVKEVFNPNCKNVRIYEEKLKVYTKIYPALRDVNHCI